jgi:hypothetical protein
MSERAEQLQATATTQIGELIDLVSTANGATLHRPCPGREKLGDGTIGASAAHAAENYQRIGTFVATSQRMANRHDSRKPDRHRIPSVLRAIGHTRSRRNQDQTDSHGHQSGYTAETVRPTEIASRLTAARQDLARIAQLTDRQLDAIPPKDSFRFCDGQRTLEQVLAALLKHQDHQVRTLKTALG